MLKGYKLVKKEGLCTLRKAKDGKVALGLSPQALALAGWHAGCKVDVGVSEKDGSIAIQKQRYGDYEMAGDGEGATIAVAELGSFFDLEEATTYEFDMELSGRNPRAWLLILRPIAREGALLRVHSDTAAQKA